MTTLYFLLIIMPFALAIITTISILCFFQMKKEKRFLKILLAFIPVWISAIICTIVVPNDIDSIVKPAKIVSFFLPIFWILIITMVQKMKCLKEH
ncbi:hypothetical protein [Acholeplasma palmae]|uniref:hypothetical protein n=1 Tax=Acholeplasma palmae TaxID=38986 RepID=UPI0005FA81CA|nr:hypothetical protein [Alteracholeplasma palmae]